MCSLWSSKLDLPCNQRTVIVIRSSMPCFLSREEHCQWTVLREKIGLSYLYSQYREGVSLNQGKNRDEALDQLDRWRSDLPSELCLGPSPLYQPSRLLIGLRMLANQTEISITNRTFLDVVKRFDITAKDPSISRCVRSAKDNLSLIACILPKANLLPFEYLDIHHAFTGSVIVHLYAIISELEHKDQQDLLAAQQFLRISADNGNSLAEACHEKISELRTITERIASWTTRTEAPPPMTDGATVWPYGNLEAVDFDHLSSFWDNDYTIPEI